MADEPMSAGEVGRALERIERNTGELRRGFDGWREIVIEIRHQVSENTKDIATIQSEREAEKLAVATERRESDQGRKADRRLIFTALAAPIVVLAVGFALQILLRATGTL